MRVIAGKAKKQKLKTIDGLETRPTTDRIKETLFNMIQMEIPDCIFLDLFCGSGQVGIEALSRGARQAVFVEHNLQAAACVRENLSHTHLEENALLIHKDAISGMKQLEGHWSFDIIFMDPPYGRALERDVFEYLNDSQIYHPDTLFIVEADIDTDFSYLEPLGFTVTSYKKYKTNMHVFIHKKADKGEA